MEIILLVIFLFVIPSDWYKNPKRTGHGSAKAAGRAVRKSIWFRWLNMFVVTNTKAYLKQTGTGISTTKNIDSATRFDSEEKANNFYKNIPKAFKHIGFVVNEIKEEKEQEILWDFDNYFNPNCMENIEDEIEHFQNLLRSIYKQKEFAETELERIEKELLDIQHAAEFYNLNASKGYKLYKMLHEKRIERRKYKDQLMVISFIMEGGLPDIVNGTVLKRIQGMDNRQYRPRVLEELFEMERNA